MSCGAESEANTLFNTLVSGAGFVLPNINLSGAEYEIPGGASNPLYGTIAKITNSDLTTKEPNGTGTFDWIMRSIKNHLAEEYEKGRITGADYTRTYIELTQAALGSAVSFLVQRDQAYWGAVNAQIAAITGKVNLATAKMAYAIQHAQAYTAQANYALTKLKLSTESQTYCNLLAQLALIREQGEVQRAQTSNTRSDGSTVVGVLGKQKDLITKQIDSYTRDAEVKAAKLFSDGWTVQKTVDEGLTAPDALTNATVNDVLQSVKTNNNL